MGALNTKAFLSIRENGIWCAFLKTGKKTRYLGRFTNEMDAAKAYDLCAIRLFDKFASLNFKYCEPSKYNFRVVVSGYKQEPRVGLQKIKNMPYMPLQSRHSMW